jgi:D-glycero-alpha-D-manno-heptose-7-phosphate kinase
MAGTRTSATALTLDSRRFSPVLIVRSPVRISFGGGGTDLPSYYETFGGAVLSAAINKYFYTILGKRSDGRVQVISSDLRVCETWHDIAQVSIHGSALEIPLAVLKEIDRDVPVDLFLASEIPPGTGLGSSASVCVNILKTLTTYLQRPLSKYELAERAFFVTRHLLGKHVGKQDEYAAAFGGLNYISFHPDGTTEVEPVELSPAVLREFQSNLMLFFAGAAHHSWSILEEQEASTRSGNSATVEALHEVKALGGRMRASLERGELHRVGELLHEGWQAKRRISSKISTPRIDHLYSLGLQSGALGGKITGAGGGGFLLLYCEKPQQAAVREAMRSEGVHEMAFGFDTQGAQAIVNDPFIDADERGGSRWVFVPHDGNDNHRGGHAGVGERHIPPEGVQ